MSPLPPIVLLAVLLGAAVLYDFINGFQDGANIIATMIASHAMSARGALALAAGATFAGPFLLGTAVAHTLGAEVVVPGAISIAVAVAALVAATTWNLLTWWLRIPVSSSHALIGGLVGSTFASAGATALKPAGLIKVAAALLVSPILGFFLAITVMNVTMWALRNATPRANVLLSRTQLATAAALALSNGANDAQKTVGIIALGLLLAGFDTVFTIPWWAIAVSASMLALGTAIGGERIVRTLGARFYHIRPIHAFASQVASTALILGASLAGGPVSSTHVVSMTIVGAGAAERRSKVRWMVLREIGVAWLLTVPAAALIAMPLYAAIASLLEGRR
ncbi:MAG: anion permease [Bacillota bacterium]